MKGRKMKRHIVKMSLVATMISSSGVYAEIKVINGDADNDRIIDSDIWDYSICLEENS